MLSQWKQRLQNLQPHLASFALRRLFQSSTDNYSKLIEKCTCTGALHSGKAIHAHLVINGFARSTLFSLKLGALYIQCGKLNPARKLFDKIPSRDFGRWVVFIGAYARSGHYEEALGVFSEMQRAGVEPDRYILPSVLKACGHLSDQMLGKQLHGLVLRRSFDDDAFVDSALIDMYSKSGEVKAAMRVFAQMAETDVVFVNAMVSGYVQHGLVHEALELVKKMELMRLKPNLNTWNSLIAGFSRVGDGLMISKLFSTMRQNGVEPDVVTWTSVISGFVQNFRNDEALGTFKQMLDHGLRPTSATLSSILSACATVADLKRGKEIHGYAVTAGVVTDIYVRSALVDVYSKCGSLNTARTLFNTMLDRTTATWNSMIFGYANHGYCDEAFELFNHMETHHSKKLDHLTFTAVLNACSHAGLADLGQRLFHVMQENYKIKPRLEHFASLVDLFGRVGRLSEAYELTQTMPMEPDSFVWGALLGACRQHGNVELAEVAAKHLAQLEPGSSGSAVLLSGLYSETGRWNTAAKMRKMIMERKLRNSPGCSWIGTT